MNMSQSSKNGKDIKRKNFEKQQSDQGQNGLKKGKNSKYFLNLEKQDYNIKHIKKLICNTRVVLTNPKAIIDEEKQYDKKLYSSNKENNPNLSSTELQFFDNPEIPKLSIRDKNLCDMILQKKDYALVLTNLANDNPPGSDGLSTNFYKFFWLDISDLLIDNYNYTFESKGLSQE